MVRFGATIKWMENEINISFNSSMVRFGENLPLNENNKAHVFQFQYGAIWRRCDIIERAFELVSIPVWCDLELIDELQRWAAESCFNSSMVRFGDYVWIDNKSGVPCFNSSMVRFGVAKIHSQNTDLYRFNSSMVRFGEFTKWKV